MELMASGQKATSVNRRLSTLRTFYKYLLKKNVVAVSPMQGVSGPKKVKPLPQFVREVDMELMLNSTGQGDTWQDVRNHTILQLFYETGIRLSELIGLNDADVDFGRMTIKVTGKRNKQRIVPIGVGMSRSLKKYVDARNENLNFASLIHPSPLFVTDKGVRVYPYWVYRLVHKSLSQVVTLKKRSPHVLRHTFATAMLNNDAELGAVKELMGHASVSTTQIYTHTTFEELKKAYSKAHPRASINQ
jgi:integrase/recombinase XerC